MSKFAEQYIGCRTVANIMGLNEETVRKRAKAGKIPAQLVSNGGRSKHWLFKHVDLVNAGIQPFAGHILASAPPAPSPIVPVNKTHVVFVLDRSGSMDALMVQARRNLQEQLRTLRSASGPNDEYVITVIAFDDKVKITGLRMTIDDALGKPVDVLYPSTGGMTALNSAIYAAINEVCREPGDTAVLISVVTDGGENSSDCTTDYLRSRVNELTNKGRYTFAFAGPSFAGRYAASIGVLPGNVTLWDGTMAGIQKLGDVTRGSMMSYATNRSVGTMSSVSFYAQPVTTNPQAFAQQLHQNLIKLEPSKFRIERVMPGDPLVIRQFCEKKLGMFPKGRVYYQLTESEKVQEYKGIVIQDTATGSFYAGWEAAAKLLQIPKFNGTVHIRPGSLGEFKVFIQSTSVNRKLKPGTAIVCINS